MSNNRTHIIYSVYSGRIKGLAHGWRGMTLEIGALKANATGTLKFIFECHLSVLLYGLERFLLEGRMRYREPDCSEFLAWLVGDKISRSSA